MARHLSNKELDAIQKMSGQGKTAQQIHDRIRISRARGKQAQDPPNISRIYAVLKGQSFNRGPKETRGRPKLKVLSRLLCARKKPQKKDGTKTKHSQLGTPDSRLAATPIPETGLLGVPTPSSEQPEGPRSLACTGFVLVLLHRGGPRSSPIGKILCF